MYDILNVYLENGLRVVVHRIPEIKNIACGAWVQETARRESTERETISYMLEQLMTNMDNQGTEGLTGALGFADAEYTTEGKLYPFEDQKQNKCFFLTGISDTMESCIKKMLYSLIDSKNLSKERKASTNPFSYRSRVNNIVNEQSEAHYRYDSNFSRMTKDRQKAEVIEIHGKYKPENVTLMIIGNVDYQKTLDIIIECFKKTENTESERAAGRRTNGKPEAGKNAVLSIGFNICPPDEADTFKYGEKENLYIEVLARILGDMGLEWRGVSHFRNKKGSLCQFTSFTNFYEDKGRFTYTSVCSMDVIEDVAKFIVSKFNQAKIEGLSEEQIERAQRLVKLNRLLKMKNLTSELKFLDKCVNYGQLFSMEKELSCVEEVDVEALNNIFREIVREDTLSFEIIGKYNVNRLVPAIRVG